VQTPVEQILWNKLRNRGLIGLKFRRQHPIGTYITDFYCAQHRLVIELDGEIHLGQIEQDAERTAQLEAHGYRVLRVWNEEVETDLEGVLRKIISTCG
jgi:very-short-patch-repair endonuclease